MEMILEGSNSAEASPPSGGDFCWITSACAGIRALAGQVTLFNIQYLFYLDFYTLLQVVRRRLLLDDRMEIGWRMNEKTFFLLLFLFNGRTYSLRSGSNRAGACMLGCSTRT